MKALLFSIGLLTSFFCQAQENSSSEYKPFRFGFNLGLQQSFLIHNAPLPIDAEVDNALGYRLGILGKYQSEKKWFAILRTELAVNHSSFMYKDTAGTSIRYDIAPTTIQSALHFGYSFEELRPKPFVYGGLNFKYPFQQNIDKSSTFPTGQDLALEVGIGIKKKFEYFDLIPEIRYSHGLNNVNRMPIFQSIYMNELSFSLIFM